MESPSSQSLLAELRLLEREEFVRRVGELAVEGLAGACRAGEQKSIYSRLRGEGATFVRLGAVLWRR